MEIQSNLIIEINRSSSDGQFMMGHLVMNGIRIKINTIPRNIQFDDLNKFFVNHAIPLIAAGKHASICYKKGRAKELN